MNQLFENREEAGYFLAAALRKRFMRSPIVLSVPYSPVRMGQVVAARLRCEFNLLLMREIKVPNKPGLMAGVVSEFGDVYFNDNTLACEGPASDALQSAADLALAELLRQRRVYGAYAPLPKLNDRDIILVHDGIPTGETTRDILHLLWRRRPRSVTIATPVMTKRALALLRSEDNAAIAVLDVVRNMDSVSDIYAENPTLTDDDIVEFLKQPLSREPERRVS